MMKCPFCEADLGAESNRLRDGRCPRCGSILSWEQDDNAQATAPRAQPANEDELSMREIVRTIVTRGAVDARSDATVAAASAPTSPAIPVSPTPTAAFGATFVAAQTEMLPRQAQDQIDNLWRGAATVVGQPLMTIKADASIPDPSITDLLIRQFRIGQQGDPPGVGAEYELQEIIGEGGVGTVYAARQASVDRVVAVKMLRNEFAHKRDHRNKFLSEAVVTGELDHPNIVPIYDLGTSDLGNLFYAMKRVRGRPWSQVIRQQSLTDNLRILMTVADAIAFSHSRGVIHRDLKPENVMLGDFGEVVVMDWGIALSTNMFVKAGRVSQSTSMGGTPAYMAPEMATGPLEAITHASDVYLLGAILFEIIAGRPPHPGKDVMSCIYAAARNEIQPTDKSGELLDIALRAMATKSADRYASVQDFQAAVREYESHSESVVLSSRADEELAEARRTRDYQDFARALFAYQEARCLWLGNTHAVSGEVEARLAYAATALEKEDYDLGISLLDERHSQQVELRRKLVAAQRERSARQGRLKALRRTALGLAAAMFLLLTTGLMFIGRQYRQINHINKDLSKTIDDLNVARVTLEDEKRNVEQANTELTKTQSRLVSSNVALAAARKNAVSEAQTARQEEQNAAAASYRAQIGVAAERIDNNAFRDAQRLLDDYKNTPLSYFRHWEWGHLQWLCDRQSGEVQVGPRIEALARSADGRILAVGTAAGQVHVYQAEWADHSLQPLAQCAFGAPIEALAVSSSGDRIAVGGAFGKGGIQFCRRRANGYEPESAEPLGKSGNVLHLAFSPRGDSLLSTGRDGAIRVWDLQTNKISRSLFGHSGPVWSAAFSPDGQQIVSGGEDATVRIWRAGDKQTPIYRGHEGAVYAVAFSPRGGWIASGGRDRDIHVWKADKDLSIAYLAIFRDLERQRRGEAGAMQRTAFHSPDFRLRGHAAEVRELEFSTDGTLLLSGGNDNTVRRWSFAGDPKSADHMTVFRGHGGWVRGCTMAPQPRYIASGSLDGTIKLWDAGKYEEVHALRGHDDAVLWAAFSSDGQRVLTAGRDRRALLWSTMSHEPLVVFDEGEQTSEQEEGGLSARLKEGHEFLVTSGAFVPGLQQIVTSAGDGTVRFWDQQTGGQLRRLSKTGNIGALAVSKDGRWLLTGSEGTAGQLWWIDDLSAPAATISGHAAEISAVAFSPAGGAQQPRMATGDISGNVHVWRYESSSRTCRPEFALRGHSPGYGITAIAFSTDGRRVLSASQDHTVLIHDAATGERLPLVLRHPGSVRAMDITADGSTAVTLSTAAKDEYRVSAWELATSTERSAATIALPGEAITSIALHPSGRSAILASSLNRSSRLWTWDLSSSAPLPLWSGRRLRGTIWSAVFSADGSHVLGVGGSQARLLAAERGDLERTFSPHGPVTAAAFSPLGRLVATSSSDGDVKLWSADSASRSYGRVILRLIRPHGAGTGSGAVNFVTFGPTETESTATLLTAGDDGTIRLWQVSGTSAAPLNTLRAHEGRVRSAVFSPSGARLISAGQDKIARVWDVQSGQAVDELRHPEEVFFAAFSEDEKLAITGCDDNNAYVWNLASGRGATVKYILQGHTAAVTCAAMSPDGRRAVTGSQDGIAKLWDMESGKEILSLKRHAAELTSVHFSPQGNSILTSSLDQTALLWPSVIIGPSIKFSSPRIDIAAGNGMHVVDPLARVLQPQTTGLSGMRLRASLSGAPATVALELTGKEVRIVGSEIQLVGSEKPIGRLRGSEPSPSIEIELSEHATAVDAERLLRAMAIRLEQPLAEPVGFAVEISDAEGQTISQAKAMIEPGEADRSPAVAAR